MKVAFRRSPLEDVDEVDEDAEGLAAAKRAGRRSRGGRACSCHSGLMRY
jgi:hypothetical protein